MRKITTLLIAAISMLCFQSGVFANTVTPGYVSVYPAAGGVRGTKLPAHYSSFMADFEGTGRDKLVLMLNNGDVSVHDPISGTSKIWRSAVAPAAAGFSNTNYYPIKGCDMNGDNKDDLIIFGHEYITVWYSNGSTLNLARYHYNLGDKRYTRTWGFDERWTPRMVTDVDGDGMCDIVAFGEVSVSVSYTLKEGSYSKGGPSQDLTTSNFALQRGGWSSQALFPRRVADVDGDGKKDIVGFGTDKVIGLLSRDRGLLSNQQIVLSDQSFTSGWQAGNQRFMMRLNADDKADILGFKDTVLKTATADVNGTYPTIITRELKGFAGTTGSHTWGPNVVGDINGDGIDDIVGIWNNEMFYHLGGRDKIQRAHYWLAGNAIGVARNYALGIRYEGRRDLVLMQNVFVPPTISGNTPDTIAQLVDWHNFNIPTENWEARRGARGYLHFDSTWRHKGVRFKPDQINSGCGGHYENCYSGASGQLAINGHFGDSQIRLASSSIYQSDTTSPFVIPVDGKNYVFHKDRTHQDLRVGFDTLHPGPRKLWSDDSRIMHNFFSATYNQHHNYFTVAFIAGEEREVMLLLWKPSVPDEKTVIRTGIYNVNDVAITNIRPYNSSPSTYMHVLAFAKYGKSPGGPADLEISYVSLGNLHWQLPDSSASPTFKAASLANLHEALKYHHRQINAVVRSDFAQDTRINLTADPDNSPRREVWFSFALNVGWNSNKYVPAVNWPPYTTPLRHALNITKLREWK